MKSRKLELECLEDRCVPAISLANAAPPVQPPRDLATALVAGAETSPSFTMNLFRPPAGPLGKLTQNHNETLVRERRGTRRRRT